MASSVRTLISHFVESGQFQDRNQEISARAFLAMLRGNLQLEIVIGCRSNPDEGDLELRTKSVVEVFLHAAGSIAGAKRKFEKLAEMEMAETIA